MFWRLHTAVLGHQLHEAFEFLRDLGDEVQIVTGPVLTIDPVPQIDDQPAVAITTLQDARKQSGYFAGRCTPWLFYNETDYAVSKWMPKLGDDLPILNAGGILVPFGMLYSIPRNLLQAIASPEGKVFIKPDKGHKSFTGICLSVTNFNTELQEALGPLNLDPEVLFYLAMAKQLKDVEWRFWIVNREVVAYSPYSWQNEICWALAPNKILKIAKLVAENPWQPDIAYVVDIVETPHGEVFVNEINAASTSGVYWAPIDDLLFSLREVAHAEFAGEVIL
ncbi:MAG: ATP-grasp domain-containing protein [Methylococcaceae bacterium]|jgi:hypothetical protein|nr:ATP-grasp domain-containing protein [Methylococcaceae bacterium]